MPLFPFPNVAVALFIFCCQLATKKKKSDLEEARSFYKQHGPNITKLHGAAEAAPAAQGCRCLANPLR
jgi:hypothetical protein